MSRRWVDPPEGWYVFGTHAGDEPVPPLEFSDEVDPEDGLPRWERVIGEDVSEDKIRWPEAIMVGAFFATLVAVFVLAWWFV